MEGFENYSSTTRTSIYQDLPTSTIYNYRHLPPYTTPHTTVYHPTFHRIPPTYHRIPPHIPPYTTPHTIVYHPHTTVYHQLPKTTKNYQKLPKTTKTFQSLPILSTSIDSRNSDHFEDVMIISVVFEVLDRCSFLLW